MNLSATVTTAFSFCLNFSWAVCAKRKQYKCVLKLVFQSSWCWYGPKLQWEIVPYTQLTTRNQSINQSSIIIYLSRNTSTINTGCPSHRFVRNTSGSTRPQNKWNKLHVDSLRWFSQRRSRTPHFGGAHPGAMTPKFELCRDFCRVHLPPMFHRPMFTSLEVIVLTNKHKRTNRQTDATDNIQRSSLRYNVG